MHPDTVTRWFFMLALAFSCLTCGMLLFIFFYRRRRIRRGRLRRRLQEEYSDQISAIILCESPQEAEAMATLWAEEWNRLWHRNPKARTLFIRELVKAQANLSGQAADNIVAVYEYLGLEQQSLRQLASGKWYLQVAAIQQLAALRQRRHIGALLPQTNHKNGYIRDAAQIAIVQLIGAEGLDFLHTAAYSISQWQQILLLQQLAGAPLPPGRVLEWMRSENATVVEFALRLVENFMLFDCLFAVYPLLHHSSPAVRLQALQVIKALPEEQAAAVLQEKYPSATYEEQQVILDLLPVTGTRAQFPFLVKLLENDDELIRYKALSALRQLDPGQTHLLLEKLENDPSFSYILSVITGKAQ